MAYYVEQTQKRISNELDNALKNAVSIITKNYLDKLETFEIINPSEEDIDIDVIQCGSFFKVAKLVFNKEENFLDKLTTVVNVASGINCTVATVIKSNGYSVDYYLGIVSKNYRTEHSSNKRENNAAAFQGALKGNFIGSDIEVLSADDMQKIHKEIFSDKSNKCYSAVSGIVALRDAENKDIENYVQGIENLVDSLQGKRYTIIMFADPVRTDEIQAIKQGYELLHTQLAAFHKQSLTLNESDSISFSKAQSDGISEGISKGISLTQSRTFSKNTSSSYSGGLSVIFANVSYSRSNSTGTADTTGTTDTSTETRQRTRQVTKSIQNSATDGRSLQLNYENRSVKSLLDKIDKHLERLDTCESFGAFECAAYVIADDRETALTVASNYNALMKGQYSHIQSSHINSWYRPEETKIIGKYLRSFVHPRFKTNKYDNIIVSPASVISGNELAIQIGLPKKSISGLTVIPMAPFGRNVQNNENGKMILGNMYHMGNIEGEINNPLKVNIDIESLSMHTFITGSTGSGKSTVIYSILEKLMNTDVKNSDKKIKFMVIEPAKGEYKDRFGYYDNVFVYGTNYKKTPLLRINPFSFPEDIHVLEHIERLIEIFNVCWPMYAAMPAVLKDSVERAYKNAGWNLQTSECKYKDSFGNYLFPSFIDVLHQIDIVMDESQYSSDSKGDYKGALATRVRSLTNGLYGQIFTADEIPDKQLFDENVIVDLSRIGSGETKALIMGLLVMKLQEYRISHANYSNLALQHITVMEEAHNILKRTSTEQSSESSNVLGKSVEMLANAIAEMRTYGEGFIIADQAPEMLDMSVIRNTNTKIILRLPDLSDRELVGKAAGLNDEQILELAKLKTFVAAVYQNNWLEPVLCYIDTNFKKSVKYCRKMEEKNVSDKYLELFLRNILQFVEIKEKLDNEYIDLMKDRCFLLPIDTEAKITFLKLFSYTSKEEFQHLRDRFVYSLFNSEHSFKLVKKYEDNIQVWYKKLCEVLEPDISFFTEAECKKIIAILLQEKVNREKIESNIKLYENFAKVM